MTAIYHQLKYIVNKTLHVPSSQIHLKNSLTKDLHLAEWEIDLLANHVEQTFNIHLPETAFQEAKTVKEVVFYIEKKLAQTA